MRKFPLHYLSEDDFENLTTLICNKILGVATIPFAKGKDKGKDARFTGMANCFPSESKPWNGKIIIQAKHTSKENASCSDSDFQSTLKNTEIVKVKTLKKGGELDYYMLFTNRKLTGIKDSCLKELFDKDEIEYEIIADEKIQQLLQSYPDIIKAAKLNDLLRPLEFDESDLKEIIIAIHEAIHNKKIVNVITDFSKIDIEKKNKLNNLSKTYFEDSVKKNFENFGRIETFLSSPINVELREQYDDSTNELNAKIALIRGEYAEFGHLLEDLYDYIINNNSNDLKGKKRLVRTLLHYMYWRCDIGKKE
ncbi:MAG: ABC-three component system protein [Rikenellaceae bacterium]